MSELNEKLCAFSMRWTLGGDFLRCRKCKRPTIIGWMGDADHQESCKAARGPNPWIEFRQLLAQPSVSNDEEVADFLRLARFSDGWNSYTFNDFKAFRKREIERSEAERAIKPGEGE